jgi:hypothetical protein
LHNDVAARVCVADNPHCFAMYWNVLANFVLTFWDKSKFHVNALLLHFPIESKVIIGLKKKKTIGVYP